MKQPFFSLIIPTRNRYDTLIFAVKSVLGQSFRDFELLISDNSTQEVYSSNQKFEESFEDSRIRKIRPESELAMSDHWEFAVGQSTGKYIIIFGDDDALTEGALEILHNIFLTKNIELLSWARAEYSWPDRTPREYANEFVLPYSHSNSIIASEKFIEKVVHYRQDYRYLPMFYNSAVSRSLVDKLIKKTGRVFSAFSPDIYTGYAFAYLTESYHSIGYPLSINGISSKSNGAAHSNHDKASQKSFTSMYSGTGIRWPEAIPGFYTSYLGIIEPYLQLARFFPELDKFISRKEIFALLIDTLEISGELDFKEKTDRILDNVSSNLNLQNWVKKYIEKATPDIQVSKPIPLKSRIGFDGHYLTLDASDFAIENVYDASLFIKKLYGDFNYTEQFRPLEKNITQRIKKAGAVLIRGYK